MNKKVEEIRKNNLRKRDQELRILKSHQERKIKKKIAYYFDHYGIAYILY